MEASMLEFQGEGMKSAHIEVDLIDHMGDDLRVVNAARVSFNKTSTVMVDKDEGLIRYLAKNDHWTPFAHPQITLRETVPFFVARQRFKHQIGFVYNEVSRRYVDEEPEYFWPESFRKRPEGSVKQGSGDDHPEQPMLRSVYHHYLTTVEAAYAALLDAGVAPEQARMVLPQSTMTTYYVTGSLAAFARAYTQRIDNHAQKEIQDLAVEWGKIMRRLYPVAWKYLTEEASAHD
jgi:thymidylate synthase (FAD)